MRTPAFSFDEILAPIGLERFRAEYEGKKPLHLKGRPDKFAEVMSWDKLGEVLSQITIWSQSSMKLVLDKEPIPAARYCAAAAGRDGGQVLRPDADKVKDFLRRGATLIANDVDHLNPGLAAFSHAMERDLGGQVQGNLYLSSRRRQGFAAHFDTHEVFAVHVEGTKTWHVYEGRAADPIAHPMFRSYGQEYHDKAKGSLLMEVHMEPGDLLYLPRGQYHDAIADDGGAVHIAFGVTYVIGLDVVSTLYERMMLEPLFRANLPRPDGDDEPLRRAPARAERGHRRRAGRPRRRSSRSRRCSASSITRVTATIFPGCSRTGPTSATACARPASGWCSRAAASAWCARARAPRPRCRPTSARWSAGCWSARSSRATS